MANGTLNNPNQVLPGGTGSLTAVSNANAPQNPTPKTDVSIIKAYLWRCSLSTILLGLIMIGFICSYSENKWTLSFGSGVLIAGGALLSGSFLGFLFGIPNITQDPTSRVKYNDSLMQISDWLTKIIVGVGLTQLYNIPSFIRRIGVHFQANFGDNIWARNVAIAIMVYYFILGFIMIYFWAKTDYSAVMIAVDDELNTVKKELETVVKEKEVIETILKDVSDEKEMTAAQLEDVNKEIETKAEVIKTFANQVRFSSKNNDPQKGKWGGSSESNGRKVTAAVTELAENAFDKEWFSIIMEVVSTDQNKPLTGEVLFHLHPSFPNQDRTVKVEGGKAIINLLSYGAFTAGIECDEGATKLEIDLAELADAPQIFKER